MQYNNRCRHVSFSLRLQRLHNGEISCLDTFFFHVVPHVLSYINISICEICTSIIHFASQKRLDLFRCRSLLEYHFLTYGNVFDTWKTIYKFVFFFNIVLEVSYPSCWIEVGGMDGIKGWSLTYTTHLQL